MAGFDVGAVYHSDSLFAQPVDSGGFVDFQQAKRKFKEFLRQYNVGGLSFTYRYISSIVYFLSKETNSSKIAL